MKRTTLILLGLLSATFSTFSYAQFDGARVYWSLPKNTNIIGVHHIEGTANASWSNWSAIQPDIDIESELFLMTYTRIQPILGRQVNWQLSVPMATTKTSSLLPVSTQDTYTNGFGDPTLGATINIFGSPGMKAKEFLRHDTGLSVFLGVNVTAPIGQYDSDETLNIGSNQWKTRLSLPIVKSLTAWVPGNRTTLEVMPSLIVFGDNDDAQGGSIEQDSMFGLEVHLTRDVTESAFISLDYTLLKGGEETLLDATGNSTIRETEGIDTDMLGFTFGFEINPNLRLNLTHMQTLSEQENAFELEGSITKLTLLWSWHDVLEKVRRFKD